MIIGRTLADCKILPSSPRATVFVCIASEARIAAQGISASLGWRQTGLPVLV